MTEITYVRGTSSQFVHFHDGKWFIYQKLNNGNFLTPKSEVRRGITFTEDSYFSNSPLLNIAYSYTKKRHALFKAKELYEAKMFI